LDGIYYAVGVYDFSEDTVLPTSAVEVDPEDVPASVCGDANGERIPVGVGAVPSPTALRDVNKK